ncbi:ABC transporter ATP-binding protein [Thalassobacterium sedimentorum]|nr:ABC transporter ATP-binding protein [Coraliomargarita sp. SDUM461004]
MTTKSNNIPMVQLTQAHKRFGETTVLEDINFQASKGEFISLVGPSGCGKSTLLKIIAGLHSLSEGEVVVDGMNPKNAREEMAFIFQEANLLPWKRVQQNTELPLKLRGESTERRVETARKMLELVNLSHALDKFPWQLSGGMRMRVSIARALTLAPRVLLLDEPFGALDEMTRDNLNEDLLRIHARDQWTAFFVTHSAAEAVFLSNKVVVLSANPGRISQVIEIDLPKERNAELREDPAYLNYVAKVSNAIRTVH